MKSNKNMSGKASIKSMIRMAQISEHSFYEILPNSSTREVENKKNTKKKKQNNAKVVSRSVKCARSYSQSASKQNQKFKKE